MVLKMDHKIFFITIFGFVPRCPMNFRNTADIIIKNLHINVFFMALYGKFAAKVAKNNLITVAIVCKIR